MNLIKDTEVAALLNVPLDAQITNATNAVNADVLRGTARTFERKSRVVTLAGYGLDYLFLPEAPIFSVTEVRIDASGKFDDSSIISDLTQFHFETSEESRDFDFRLFWSGGYFPEGPRTSRITLDCGYYPADDPNESHQPRVPEDLRQAMIVEAAQRARRGAGEKYQSASLGDFSYTRRGEAESDYRQMIRRYRRP